MNREITTPVKAVSEAKNKEGKAFWFPGIFYILEQYPMHYFRKEETKLTISSGIAI